MGQQRTTNGSFEKVKGDTKSNDILEAAGALAECAAQLETEPCKGAMGRATILLLNQIEEHCRQSIQFLLQGLGNVAEGGDAQFDRVWTLHVMARRSIGMKECIIACGGDTAVLAAMAASPEHERLICEGSWFIYDLRELVGLEAMLQHPSPAVQAAGAWVVYDLAGKKHKDWPSDDSTAAGLVSLLLGVLRRDATTAATLWAACSALGRIVYARATWAKLMVTHGGGEAVVLAVRASYAAQQRGGPELQHGIDLLGAGAKLVSAIAEGGDDQTAQRLRDLGAIEALTGGGCRIPEKCANDVIWALGQLGGPAAVIEAIQKTSSSPHSIYGLNVLAELLWQPSEENHRTLVQIAPAVLNLTQTCLAADVAAADFALAIKSLGGILHTLSPHVNPGTWEVADRGMQVLAEAVSREHTIAKEAVECLGKIAALSPAWRRPLEGTLGIICQRIRSPMQANDRGRLKKYLFWAMAAIAGLPAVIIEMRSQQQNSAIQDASICAIIDIFDDNLDGEFCLKGEKGDSQVITSQVQEAMVAVVEAMRQHRSCLPVQYRGAHALGILFGLLPEGNEVPAEVLEVVLAAWWRNPTNLRVGSGVCIALRSFLSPMRGRGTSGIAGALSILRAQDVAPSLRHALVHSAPEGQGGASDEEEARDLLEGAAYTLGLLEGPETVLDILYAAPLSSAAACSLKALCELGRAFPELFPLTTAAKVVKASEELALANGADADVRCHGELLRGLMRSMGQAPPLFP